MTLVSPKPLSISNSEIQTWKSCRRRWYLSYYLEYGLRKTHEEPFGARWLGSRVHLALQMFYDDGTNPVAFVSKLYEDAAAEIAMIEPSWVTDLQKEAALARAMLEGYVEWLQETGADEGLHLVATEQELVVKTGIENVTLRGKLDQRIVREADGARLFLDHKTVGDMSTLPKLAPIDEQMLTYHLLEFLHAMDVTGEEPPEPTDGGLYNMLRKVKRTATAKPPFYDRVEVRHNKTSLRSHYTAVHAVLSEIVQARIQLDNGGEHNWIAYKRPSRDCTWACPFAPVCPMLDDGSRWRDMLDEWYTHVDPYERYDGETMKGVQE